MSIQLTTTLEFPQEDIFGKWDLDHIFDWAAQILCENQQCGEDGYEYFMEFNMSLKHMTEFSKDRGTYLSPNDFKKYPNLNASFGNSNNTTLTIKY